MCLAISDKFGGATDHHRACLVVGACIFNWTRSHAEADAVLEQAQTISNFQGDSVFSSFIYFGRALQIYTRSSLVADMTLYKELMEGNEKHCGGSANTKGTLSLSLSLSLSMYVFVFSSYCFMMSCIPFFFSPPPPPPPLFFFW